MSNLLKDRYPCLLKMWDYERNSDTDINQVTYGSHLKVWWRCSNNHEFEQEVFHRARAKHECYICYRTNNRLCRQRDLSLRSSKSTTTLGDSTEDFIQKLIQSQESVISVDRIGYLNGIVDLVVQIKDGTFRGIQVKTLIFYRNSHHIHLRNKQPYPYNMLLLMADSERQKFVIEFAGNITVESPYFTFGNPKLYKKGMFTDIEQFGWAITQLLSCSYEYIPDSNITSKTTKLENEMLKRLEEVCVQKRMSFRRNKTSGDTIDCFINGIAVQAKYCSLTLDTQKTYKISMHKLGGRLSGRCRSTTMSYHYQDPFQLVIVEVGGISDDVDRYKGHFCIIPKSELLIQNILQSSTCPGKIMMYICSPERIRGHWSKKYWNNFSLLEAGLIDNPSLSN